MITDSVKPSDPGPSKLTPMQIARHDLLDAREKLELLQQLKSDAMSLEAEAHEFGFSPREIDQAIAHLRRGIEAGMGTNSEFKGE